MLLPCRDAASTVDEALASLAAQTFEDFEVIAVDDGSTDQTAARLREWSTRDARIRLLTTPSMGIVPALNRAAALARGHIFARMDADDVAHPERFALQVALLDDSPDLDGTGTLVRYFPRTRLRDGTRRYERWVNGVVTPDQIERDMFVECAIPHPTLMLRRDAFERIGGYVDHGWPEDYDLILRLWTAGMRLAKVDRVLLEWRDRGARLSRTDPRYGPGAFRRCKIRYLAKRISGRSIVIWGAGPVGKRFARALHDAGYQVSAFIDLDPRKIGQIVHDAPVLGPRDVPSAGTAYILAAVGRPEARNDIRRVLYDRGHRDPEHFCAVA